MAASGRGESGLKPVSSNREIDALRAALDEHALVAITDVRGAITYANEKFCQISKYSRDQLIGANHRILNSGHHPREFFRDMWSTISAGKVWKGEIRNRAADGSIYWVASTIVPFFDDRGRPRQYVSIRTDITKQKLTEESLARSNKALAGFAYAASHDLQEPLRGITGCVELLTNRLAGALDAKGLELLRHVAINTARMRDLVRGLLDLAHLEHPPSGFAPADCNLVLAEVKEDLRCAIQESGAIITSQPLPAIAAHPPQLARLFQNLIGNAIKFRGPRRPQVQVSAAPVDNAGRIPPMWEFIITDNGIGVDPDRAGDIFGMFQRLNPEKYPGTGIGLAICKGVVERYGGRIWVERAPDGGAAFHFTLPGADVAQARSKGAGA
ncbi:MAG: ATP-binding protein [Bryobacteraceae bacterium]|nr:ATP-binding protein [Bryobacteraceae bacterium]